MHELSLVGSILEIVRDYAAEHGFSRVNALRLSFGRLSCIDPGALEFAFAVRSEGTPARGARLDFEILPAVVHCFACDRDSELRQAFFSAECPCCRSREVLLTGGTEELKLLELEVD
jgi:hydrogenase nickel incorporation protein HypA/HybF